MDPKQLALLINDAATRHGLPPSLVAAMAQVESEGNPWATRYEPGFYTRYVEKNPDVKAVSPCSLDTERRLRATSFGLLQVMGQVARERGFKGAYLTQLCDPATGLDIGCKHLAAFAARFKEPFGWSAVCAAYNGGAGAVKGHNNYTNAEYPAKVLKALGGTWPA